MTWFSEFIEKLKKAKKVVVRFSVNKEIYEYVEIREPLSVCESCSAVGNNWVIIDDVKIPLCDMCLIKEYGRKNIEILE